MSRILVVEDSKILANALSKKIAAVLNWEVTTVSTLKKAKEFAEENEISVAVLDLTLPDAMEGEVVDYFVGHRIPSIVFTGTFDNDLHDRIMRLDVFDYVTKDNYDSAETVTRSIQRLFANEHTKIMIVDDSRSARMHIRNQLNRYRFHVLEAAGSDQALETLSQHPDTKLMITDYNMPGMDGFELIGRVRKSFPMERLAIIGMSSRGEPVLSAKFLKKGANDFLAKPFFREELYNKIVLNIEMIENFGKIRKQAESLSLLNEQKNRFLGMAAHDLRNPLASIRGFSEIILSDDSGSFNAEQKEFLEFIHNLSNQMLQLVNDLLDVSVIESGKLDLKVTEGSLTSLVKERIRIHRVIADKKNIRISEDIAGSIDGCFDAGRISEVIDNLLSNAIKFSEPATTIYAFLKPAKMATSTAAVVSIKDEGPGLSDEDKARLFGEFQKLSARPTGGEVSTGLGLSIVKKIVEAHGGTIKAESKLGEGSTFRVTLPLKHRK